MLVGLSLGTVASLNKDMNRSIPQVPVPTHPAGSPRSPFKLSLTLSLMSKYQCLNLIYSMCVPVCTLMYNYI